MVAEFGHHTADGPDITRLPVDVTNNQFRGPVPPGGDIVGQRARILRYLPCKSEIAEFEHAVSKLGSATRGESTSSPVGFLA